MATTTTMMMALVLATSPHPLIWPLSWLVQLMVLLLQCWSMVGIMVQLKTIITLYQPTTSVAVVVALKDQLEKSYVK